MDPAPEPQFPRQQESSAPWMPIGIGVVLLLAVVTALVLFSRRAPQGPPAEHPYAPRLQFSDLQLSGAENFVGGSVTYLDGKLTNAGDRTITGITVELTFRNALDEVVQRETLRVMGLSRSGPYPDVVDLRSAPIPPGQAREIRLALEHISADWNRSYPHIKVTSVSFKDN